MGPRRIALALLGILLAAGPARAAEVSDRDKTLRDLAVLISSTIARQDTKNPVFHGCADWHSAAHGHWALLRVARVTGGSAAEAEAADRSLDPEGLAKELDMLKNNPFFEMPYGRAWFLRLAIEHDLWSRKTGGKDPDRLKKMADFVAGSVLEDDERIAQPGMMMSSAINRFMVFLPVSVRRRYAGRCRSSCREFQASFRRR